MVRALGWSSDIFDPTDPGRLCRGRERWIESYPADAGPELFRVVVSGAAFSDDSARDAERGLSCSGVAPEAVLRAIFPDQVLLAWCEEGHPLRVPEGAIGVEDYDLCRPGGPLRQWAARWILPCASADDLARALAAGADCLTVHDGPLDELLGDDGAPHEALRQAVFLLTGSRNPGPPTRRFQPVAIVDVLRLAQALVLVHDDKHASCLGVYTQDEIDPGDLFDRLVDGTGAIAVPFAIPPMLARWDRALWELRQDWDETVQGDFPVPPAPEGSWGWNRRRRPRAGDGEE